MASLVYSPSSQDHQRPKAPTKTAVAGASRLLWMMLPSSWPLAQSMMRPDFDLCTVGGEVGEEESPKEAAMVTVEKSPKELSLYWGVRKEMATRLVNVRT